LVWDSAGETSARGAPQPRPQGRVRARPVTGRAERAEEKAMDIRLRPVEPGDAEASGRII